MASDIVWKNIKVKLEELKPWAENPRLSTKEEAQRTLDSFDKFNQVDLFAVSPDLDVYNGHQRLSALLTKYGPKYQVEARQSSRLLTDEERRQLTIYLNGTAQGQWNWDILSSWNPQELRDWGFNKGMLESFGRDFGALTELLNSENPGQGNENYTRKIETPIYQPAEVKPEISELFDLTKTKKLIKEIDGADLPEEEKEFLRVAAYRHAVINFRKVADYYSLSEKKTQLLMENSALVIIDFDKAIELGFVEMTKEIIDIVREEYGDE
jgi:hypothetical protein